MTNNPLRRPKPSRKESLYRATLYFADANGKIAGQLGHAIALGREYLWLTDEIAIPLSAIRTAGIVEHGGFPKRRSYQLTFENPISRRSEQINLVNPTLIGFYPSTRLLPLLENVERARASLASSPGASPGQATERAPVSAPTGCEVCNATPAWYVGYTYLVSFLVVSYRGAAKRRVHCKKHNLIYGLGHYLLTALTGWFGIGIFGYPFVVWAAARSLTPSLGRATYALAGAPIVVVGGLIVHWLR
ncbi:MAG: hypothetical protein JST54_29895 [Deltaproteobacteria bacterium]|nr:hypothetical protein [Deltaproteobacteria bacterium]